MIVCVCKALRERDISNAVKQGCHSYKALVEQTGCCVECGQCASKIKAMFRVHQSGHAHRQTDAGMLDGAPSELPFAATGT
jgi:bacterioferritin-associated ferredoxin